MTETFLSRPNYHDLYENIKKHLSRRSGMLAGRVLLITWPGLIYIALISILSHFDVPEKFAAGMLVAMIIFAPFAFLYIFVLTHIFSIEKVIWIDSYHDGVEVGPKKSMLIAKRLFWPTFLFRLFIFVRYYVPLFGIYVFLVIYSLYLPYNYDNLQYNPFYWVIGAIGVGPLLLYLYYYYLKVKLRYIWFIFLDLYGSPEFSYKNIFQEMKRLNDIGKADAFKKSLVVNLGADVAQNILQFSLGTILQGTVGSMGKSGRVVADVATAYSNELAAQASSLARQAANYVLYLYSRQQLYGEASVRNKHLYVLGDKEKGTIIKQV